MKRWIPTRQQLKELPNQIIEVGNGIIFNLGVVFLILLVATAATFLSGVAQEELPKLELALLVKGPLPYIWFGVFGIWLATKVKGWIGTVKELKGVIKARPEFKARIIQLWNTARGYTT